MSEKYNEGATPESLMESFKGVSAAKMIAFTLVFHVVMIGATSVTYLKKTFFGDSGKLTREEKITRAVDEATSALRKIAAENGLNPQDISDRFGTARAQPPQAQAAPAQPAAAQAAVSPTEAPKSTVETQIEQKAPGPKMPAVGETSDIF